MKLKKKTARKNIKKVVGTPLTEEKFEVYFESLKDLITSSVSASETSIRKDVCSVRKDISMLHVAVSEHTRLIKGLDTRMGGVENQIKGLGSEVSSLGAKVSGLDAKIDVVRTELKDDMHQMEVRLSDKIDGHAARLDNHESRITLVEAGRV